MAMVVHFYGDEEGEDYAVPTFGVEGAELSDTFTTNDLNALSRVDSLNKHSSTSTTDGGAPITTPDSTNVIIDPADDGCSEPAVIENIALDLASSSKEIGATPSSPTMIDAVPTATSTIGSDAAKEFVAPPSPPTAVDTVPSTDAFSTAGKSFNLSTSHPALFTSAAKHEAALAPSPHPGGANLIDGVPETVASATTDVDAAANDE